MCVCVCVCVCELAKKNNGHVDTDPQLIMCDITDITVSSVQHVLVDYCDICNIPASTQCEMTGLLVLLCTSVMIFNNDMMCITMHGW